MSRPPVSVTIITLNEEQNIARAISSVRWADEIIVVDSGSTDRTQEIAREMGARVLAHPWPGYGAQKNFAQKHATYSWVLNIDADEEVSPELAKEIQDSLVRLSSASSPADSPRAFSFPRKTFFLGRWIRYGGWYPNYLVRLADQRYSQWTEPHVHEALRVDGSIARLEGALHNYAFPSIRDQIETNLNFSRLGSQDLKRRGKKPTIALLLLKPVGKFLETYFWKRGFLDGLPGFIISINAAHSMFLKYAFLIEDEGLNHR